MKIEIECEQRLGGTVGETAKTPITFTDIGHNAWVRIDVCGMSFEIDAHEFQRVAAAVWSGE